MTRRPYSTPLIDCVVSNVTDPDVRRRGRPVLEAAGSDADLIAERRHQDVESRAAQGAGHLETARVLLRGDRPDVPAAEREARAGLSLLARSLDWAEDTNFEDDAHQRMDEAGRWVRSVFGCAIEWDGTSYFETCPVALGHNRIGMSVGGVAVRICSLCGEDLSECEHLRGVAYFVPGGAEDLGWCRVCLFDADCDHSRDQRYRVGVVSIIREMQITEVSLVNKPAHPGARLLRVSVPFTQLQEVLGPELSPGDGVSCDKCLLECDGLRRHPEMLAQGSNV